MKKLSLSVGFLFYTSKVCLYGAGFELPAGTPGLDQNDVQMGNINCKHVHIPNTNYHLYFPTDGSQPDTSDAGLWSGTRHIGMPNDDLVTDWWVRVFGGNKAVYFSNGHGQVQQPKEPKMGTHNGNPAAIIHVNTIGALRGFKQQFWQAFRGIAADPVGRVLLYRLLIEIRRVDDAGNGCCGDEVSGIDLDNRNECRSIRIVDNNNNGFSFNTGGLIRVDFDLTIETSVLSLNNNGTVTTTEERRPPDVGLFHEMLHWFHFLRNSDRYNDGDSNDPNVFKYALRCYYGDQNELGMWGGSMDNEEIANILGIPNHTDVRYQNLIAQNALPSTLLAICNDGFLNGDDLSENVYRISKQCHMRFGHCDYQIVPIQLPPFMPNRFVLANTLAVNCYHEITGIPLNSIHWDLAPSRAIKP